MADLKISQLDAISILAPAVDVLPVVSGGVTKKITTNQILGSGGTAILASATITGDLTAARLIVTGGTIPTNGLWLATTNTLEFAANSLAQYRIAPLGVFSWFDGAGGTRMTLNSTGLGISQTPSTGYRLSSGRTTGGGQFAVTTGLAAGSVVSPLNIDLDFLGVADNVRARIRSTDTSSVTNNGILEFWTVLSNVASRQMVLDASGNLLVGTTVSPSGTKIGSIAKLGKVNVEGTNTVTVSTSVVPLARAFDSGGLFFISGYNTTGGSQCWFLVAARGSAVTTIASDNGTGLTVAFTIVSGAILSMNTTSGTLNVSCISMTNQSV